MTEIVYLGMAVVAAGDAIVCTGFHNLIIFQPSVGAALIGVTRLQEASAAAAAVVVGFVGRHFNDIFFSHYRFDDISQIICDDVTIAFANDLAGVLNGKFDFPVLVPFRADFEPSLPYPFGIVGVDGSNFEFMIDIVFFQSSPD